MFQHTCEQAEWKESAGRARPDWLPDTQALSYAMLTREYY
jgi:hypothetical protein